MNSGSAYIFERNAGGEGSWGQVAKLTASDAAERDEFAKSVAISGDTVVVGAQFNDDAGTNSGSAYLYERGAGGADNWGEVKKLTASDAASGNEFGASVSISGDTIVVGAPKDDEVASFSGSAYVYERNAGGTDNWGQVRRLAASDGAWGANFGGSTSISGDTFVGGAKRDDDGGTDSGSAYTGSVIGCEWVGPVEISGVTVVDLSAGTVIVSWDSQDATTGYATNYDVARGTLSLLLAGYPGETICAQNDNPDTPYTELAGDCGAAVGDGCWYHVRAQGCRTGTYGTGTFGNTLDPGPCP